MDEPRWVADEMVGRLARYLRFVGHDTIYARGLTDDAIAELARSQGRVLLTRDRALAARVPGALLLTSPAIGDQLRAVHRAFPTVPFEVRLDRCTLCNGRLTAWSPPTTGEWPEQVPRERVAAGLAVGACVECGHLYWEGTHAERIRHELANWLGAEER